MGSCTELTFGAMIKQFLTQSFIQSAAANAGPGDDSTAAPPIAVPMMEANELRRDRSMRSLEGCVGGQLSPIPLGDVVFVGPIWKNEKAPADKSRIAPMNKRMLICVVIVIEFES